MFKSWAACGEMFKTSVEGLVKGLTYFLKLCPGAGTVIKKPYVCPGWWRGAGFDGGACGGTQPPRRNGHVSSIVLYYFKALAQMRYITTYLHSQNARPQTFKKMIKRLVEIQRCCLSSAFVWLGPAGRAGGCTMGCYIPNHPFYPHQSWRNHRRSVAFPRSQLIAVV